MLLAIARVEVVNKFGTSSQVFALLDQGSEVSFISESIVQLLSLSKRRVEVSLTGIEACNAGTTRGITTFELYSLSSSNFVLPVEAYCYAVVIRLFCTLFYFSLIFKCLSSSLASFSDSASS
jgi:hypothetical protein